MKTNLTLLKASAIAFFLFISGSAFSATYYTCAGTTLNLAPSAAPANITYSWDIKKDGTSTGVVTTAPTSFADAGVYEVILLSTATTGSGVCAPDPVSNEIIVLPALTVALTAPTTTYCEGLGDATSSVITPTAQSTTYSTDVAFEYSYTITRGGTNVTVAEAGTLDAATGVLTLNIKTPGEYSIVGSVKYIQASGNTTKPFLGAGCPATSGTPTTITVTAKPTQPTVTITAS
ncbi:hypothetical protein PBAL39_25225 [Pedobacter sp. BAL39]|uniref:hypothetical protein n=1 Tax=Pedobacter sp. BAL39 TaxID=391596 RepID=UPI00015591F0|nr:hypothetical protein [Pedobacter sp. BAL39]EDM36631.1 hypothetical protein PBAL39_25225 [Pedobacter sp. BAL39]